MSNQQATDAEVEAASLAIRAEILATPGAQSCSHRGCMVIIQGGHAAMKLHQDVVHGDREWGPMPWA